jgi:hypothetical protein
MVQTFLGCRQITQTQCRRALPPRRLDDISLVATNVGQLPGTGGERAGGSGVAHPQRPLREIGIGHPFGLSFVLRHKHPQRPPQGFF